VAAALYAAGGTTEATRSRPSVVSDDLDLESAVAVAVVRLPGHHSECGYALGIPKVQE
jgi:hypothetical protein